MATDRVAWNGGQNAGSGPGGARGQTLTGCFRGRRELAALGCSIGLLAGSAHAEDQEGSVTLFDRGGFTIKAGGVLGVQAVGQSQAFWNLDETFAPGSGFNASPVWGETYLKPYLTFRGDLGGVEAYGKLSVIASANIGTDVFDIGDASEILIEDAFIGLRNGTFDISVGAQPYRLGTGMLLADGAGDGFERRPELRVVGHQAEEFSPGRREVAVDREELGDAGVEGFRHLVGFIVAADRREGVEAGGPLVFEGGDALEEPFEVLAGRGCSDGGAGGGQAVEELLLALVAAGGDVAQGLPGGDGEGLAVRLGDELPEWLAEFGGVGFPFEVGAVEELHHRLADLAAAGHGQRTRVAGSELAGMVRLSSWKTSIIAAAARAASRPRLSLEPMVRA